LNGYAVVDVAAVPREPGPHPAASPYDRDIGAALGVRAFGIYQVELPPDGASVLHDHAVDGAQDVYVILRGSGSVMVDGEPVPMRPGACIAVSAASTRQVRAGDAGLVYLAVCASDA
jgi:uncharacterized cupin superfamily protein